MITKYHYFLCVDSQSYKATADQNQCGMRIHADPNPNTGTALRTSIVLGIFSELSSDWYNMTNLTDDLLLPGVKALYLSLKPLADILRISDTKKKC